MTCSRVGDIGYGDKNVQAQSSHQDNSRARVSLPCECGSDDHQTNQNGRNKTNRQTQRKEIDLRFCKFVKCSDIDRGVLPRVSQNKHRIDNLGQNHAGYQHHSDDQLSGAPAMCPRINDMGVSDLNRVFVINFNVGDIEKIEVTVGDDSVAATVFIVIGTEEVRQDFDAGVLAGIEDIINDEVAFDVDIRIDLVSDLEGE